MRLVTAIYLQPNRKPEYIETVDDGSLRYPIDWYLNEDSDILIPHKEPVQCKASYHEHFYRNQFLYEIPREEEINIY